MKISKLLTSIGFTSIACSTIIPITSCSINTTWSDVNDKKVKFILKESKITLDQDSKGVIVFDMDRELKQSDFEDPKTTLKDDYYVFISQKVENHTVTLTYKFDKTKVPSGTVTTFTLKVLNYRAIDNEVKVEINY